MKLRNKKTGKIDNWCIDKDVIRTCDGSIVYNSLAELNEEWEDYEEPKQDALSVMILTLTNYIENEPSDNVDLDECKNMLEKLKAWERLKDKGFRFTGCGTPNEFYNTLCYETDIEYHTMQDLQDFKTLFGGEDE